MGYVQEYGSGKFRGRKRVDGKMVSKSFATRSAAYAWVDEVGPSGMDDEDAALRVLDRYGELCVTLADVEQFDPNSEEKPGAVEAFVRQADADMLFRHDVREALVAFGAVDKDDKETDLLAMLRALLEI